MSENRLNISKISGLEDFVDSKVDSTIVNALDSTEVKKSLSAKQGYLLANTKLNKVMGSVVGNVPVFSSDGHIIDSGKSLRIKDIFNGYLEFPESRDLPLILILPFDIKLEEFSFISGGTSSLSISLLDETTTFLEEIKVGSSLAKGTTFKNRIVSKGSGLKLRIKLEDDVTIDDFSYTIVYSRELF